MSTKEKIVSAAIDLFNNHGINNVSIRDIGNKIGISSGNFAYHFKNKEALLEHFYANMYNDISVNHAFDKADGFIEFQALLVSITDFMMTYNFFYTDIIDIFRLCPEIKKNYASNYEGRKDIYQKIFVQFAKNDVLVANDEDPGFGDLAHKIWFTLTFWQSQKKILPPGIKEVSIGYIIKQIWNSIYPYMTDIGRREYEQIK